MFSLYGNNLISFEIFLNFLTIIVPFFKVNFKKVILFILFVLDMGIHIQGIDAIAFATKKDIWENPKKDLDYREDPCITYNVNSYK